MREPDLSPQGTQKTSNRPQSDREWRIFLDRAVHDLRAPLRGIGASAELVSEMSGEAFSPDGAQLLQSIVVGVGRMDDLLRTLAEYSAALDADAWTFGPVAIEALLRSTIESIQPMVRDTAAEIRCTPLPRVEGNWELLSALFRHLLSNALQYRGDAPPRVTVSATRDEDRWRFAVRDNGLGINSQHCERIFAPFQRLHGSDRPGAGLGLAICRRIVELHSGRIWVESTVGQGSEFLFTLPDSP